MPMSLRKVLLTCCQTGFPIDGHWRITKDTTKFFEKKRFVRDSHGRRLSRAELAAMIDEVIQTTTLRSFVSMLVRSEYCEQDTTEDVSEGAMKELLASQDVFSESQVLNYSAISGCFADSWDPEYPLTPRWVANARYYANSLSRRMEKLSRSSILFPEVQRRKNMSQDSCSMLAKDGYHRSDRQTRELGTVDLEIHYYRTGRKVGGVMEMRKAWKHNDLKPRFYYTTGGDEYWQSRYVKKIAVAFMDSHPSTHVRRRQDPTSISGFIKSEEYVVIWDYSCFTTRLSELRFFLYWVARLLEADPMVRQVPLRLFDYRTGIVLKPIWELLDEYNSGCNIFAEFSIHRIVDSAGIVEDDHRRWHHNSGGLGVHGNIGFSTSLHGIHASVPNNDKEHAVCVGDDALGSSNEEPPEIRFIKHIQRIGDIADDKFEIFPPVQEGDEHSWKFLKRRLTRTFHGLDLDFLYDFPVLADIFGIHSPERTVRGVDRETLLHRTISKIGSFYWQIYARPNDYLESDDRLVKRIFQTVYRYLGLPTFGRLPGYIVHHKGNYKLSLSVPPVDADFDPSKNDWAEFLWERRIGSMYEVPRLSYSSIDPPEFFDIGQEFETTGNKLLNAMVDIGVIRRGSRVIETRVAHHSNKRDFFRWLKGEGKPIFSCKFVEMPPPYYNELVVSLRKHPVPTDIWFTSSL